MVYGRNDVDAVCLAPNWRRGWQRGEINGVGLCVGLAFGAVYLAPTIRLESYDEKTTQFAAARGMELRGKRILFCDYLLLSHL